MKLSLALCGLGLLDRVGGVVLLKAIREATNKSEGHASPRPGHPACPFARR